MTEVAEVPVETAQKNINGFDVSTDVSEVRFDIPRIREIFAQKFCRNLLQVEDPKSLKVTPILPETTSRKSLDERGTHVLKVERADDPRPEASVYVKFISKQRMTDPANPPVAQEIQAGVVIELLKTLAQLPEPDSPFFSILMIFENDDYYGFVMPAYPHSVAERLRDTSNPVLWSEIFKILDCLDSGSVYLEKLGILHWDPSLDNLRQRSDKSYVMTDFDLGGKQSQPESMQRFNAVGTEWYLAPETLRTSMELEPICNFSTMVYSLGVEVYEIFTRGSALPYEDAESRTKNPDRLMTWRLSKQKADYTYQPLTDLFFSHTAVLGENSALGQLYNKVRALDTILSKAVARPDQRYLTAEAFFTDLAAAWLVISQAEYEFLWQDYNQRIPKQLTGQEDASMLEPKPVQKISLSLIQRLIGKVRNL